jgi:hypothetical protein
MSARLLRMIAVFTFCISGGALTVAAERPHHGRSLKQGSLASSRSADARETLPRAPRLKKSAVRTLAADRDPYADPAVPYKADLKTPCDTVVTLRFAHPPI